MAGVPQGSVLRPRSFLIYINDLPNGMVSICKVFDDDTSLFSNTTHKEQLSLELNNDLDLISAWAFQWKMLFNPDPTKQTIEVFFSNKRNRLFTHR